VTTALSGLLVVVVGIIPFVTARSVRTSGSGH
jgi:hypothetical protein